MRPAKRPRHIMPDFMSKVLREAKLQHKYDARPSYQRNDYIYWIVSAKHMETQEKRLQQMLVELRQGNVYMKMKWNPPKGLS